MFLSVIESYTRGDSERVIFAVGFFIWLLFIVYFGVDDFEYFCAGDESS